MPQNGAVNEQFGVYRSLCCSAEIVITAGAVFPRCPDHPVYTMWKLLPEEDMTQLTDKKIEVKASRLACLWKLRSNTS